ncbi:MAG: tyrosine-type recombinase/integrase [Planctomycetales bacterium]|nr:tyrosine-type recombinase/integrase [Planctomycetales bacterium]
MASIFKQTTTRPLPIDAETITKNGKRFVRVKRDGRTVLRPLTDCGTKYRDESRKWYIKFKDRNGVWQRVPGYTDKMATSQLASELERKQQQIQSGLTDPHESGKLRPLEEHLAEFQRFLGDKENSTKHVAQTVKRVQRICHGCKFENWKDISPSSVVNWLALERERGAIGVKTSNYYQAALKEFCNWLVKDGRVPSNPVTHLQSLNPDLDVRRQRRSLTDEQFAALIESAMNGPPIQCLSGPDRAMLYILAAWTGFRRKELASLTIRSLDLESSPPTVRCEAGYSKRKRNDIVPLHDIVVERLRSWLEQRGQTPASEPLFSLQTKSGGLRRTSKMMRVDLTNAGIPYCDEDGLYADFHANRHTFISNLAKAGVTPKLAQSVARHSDVNLTLGVYSHVEMNEQAAAINALPAPPVTSAAIVRKSLDNGLDNTTPKMSDETPVVQIVVQTSGSGCPELAEFVTNDGNERRVENDQKPLPQKALVTLCQQLAEGDDSSGRGTRTPDTRIMIPLL